MINLNNCIIVSGEVSKPETIEFMEELFQKHGYKYALMCSNKKYYYIREIEADDFWKSDTGTTIPFKPCKIKGEIIIKEEATDVPSNKIRYD